MCDCQDGATFKLCSDRGLYEVVRLEVHSCCRFIQDEDLGLPQQGSSKAHQLPLADAAERKETGLAIKRLVQGRLSRTGPQRQKEKCTCGARSGDAN